MRSQPQWLSNKIGHRHDPVRIVQDALSDTAGMSLHTMMDALEGSSVANCGGKVLAVALPPVGLGVQPERPVKVVAGARNPRELTLACQI